MNRKTPQDLPAYTGAIVLAVLGAAMATAWRWGSASEVAVIALSVAFCVVAPIVGLMRNRRQLREWELEEALEILSGGFSEEDVRIVQIILNVTVDGIYGPRSAHAARIAVLKGTITTDSLVADVHRYKTGEDLRTLRKPGRAPSWTQWSELRRALLAFRARRRSRRKVPVR